jgi:hypothetical protein
MKRSLAQPGSGTVGERYSTATREFRKRRLSDLPEAPELTSGSERHREVERLREPLFPGDRVAELSSEQRVERAEIKHRLIDVEDDGAVHTRLRKGGRGA